MVNPGSTRIRPSSGSQARTRRMRDRSRHTLTVSVTVAYSDVAYLPPWFMQGKNLTGQCIMPAEGEWDWQPMPGDDGGGGSDDPSSSSSGGGGGD